MFDRVPHIFKNFYFITGIIFFIWILFFDSNDLFTQIKKTAKYKALEKEKFYYEQNIETAEENLENLRSDQARLEKFARENYHMKKADEEVFIVVEKKSE